MGDPIAFFHLGWVYCEPICAWNPDIDCNADGKPSNSSVEKWTFLPNPNHGVRLLQIALAHGSRSALQVCFSLFGFFSVSSFSLSCFYDFFLPPPGERKSINKWEKMDCLYLNGYTLMWYVQCLETMASRYAHQKERILSSFPKCLSAADLIWDWKKDVVLKDSSKNFPSRMVRYWEKRNRNVIAWKKIS